METVFTAENNVEAHMIVHLLERSDISASILGEHLQGGVGELPAHGNIRVVVESGDALAARKVIAAWESERSADLSAHPEEARSVTYSGLFAFLAGAGVASMFLLWAFNSPVRTYTSDYNRDGDADEWAYWRGETLSRVDVDRDHDGDVDAKYEYSPRYGVEKGAFDNDFDGTFEYVTEYRFAQPGFDDIDLNGDGQPDRRYHYVDGVLTSVDMFGSSGKIVRKSLTYEKGVKLIEARWDSDNDGVLDTLITYGPFDEEIGRSRLPSNQ